MWGGGLWKKAEWVWTDWNSDSCREAGEEEPWEASRSLASPTELFATCLLVSVVCLPCSTAAASGCGAGPPLHLPAGRCPHSFPCASLCSGRPMNSQGLIPLVGNYFQLFSGLVEFQVSPLVCFSCGLENLLFGTTS